MQRLRSRASSWRIGFTSDSSRSARVVSGGPSHSSSFGTGLSFQLDIEIRAAEWPEFSYRQCTRTPIFVLSKEPKRINGLRRAIDSSLSANFPLKPGLDLNQSFIQLRATHELLWYQVEIESPYPISGRCVRKCVRASAVPPRDIPQRPARAGPPRDGRSHGRRCSRLRC